MQNVVLTAAPGSLSAAARLLDISRLGERYLPNARKTLKALDNGEVALTQGSGEIADTIRLSIPSSIGRNVLTPWFDVSRTCGGLTLGEAWSNVGVAVSTTAERCSATK